jgi:DNA-binding transcriptional ArsR family regulator
MILSSLDHPRSTKQLAALLGLAPSTVSYHLGVLYRAGLLDRSREGRGVLYSRV